METQDRSVTQLAHLLHQRNVLDVQIARLIHGPAYAECLGKFIAAQVFAVRLLRSKAHPDIDGHFLHGPLAGRSLKVHWYSRQDGTLDLIPNAAVNEYLVFTGTPVLPGAPADLTPAWVIERVYLFDASALAAQLQALGTSIGPYTRVPQDLWDAAEIYPRACSPRLSLDEAQIELLRLFAAGQAVWVETSVEPLQAHLPADVGQPIRAPEAAAPETGALQPSAFPPGGNARVPAAHDIHVTGDLPGTAPLPPLPPGGQFPRPVTLLGREAALGKSLREDALPDNASSGASLPDTFLPGDAFPPDTSPNAASAPPASLPEAHSPEAPPAPAPARPAGRLPKKYLPLENYLRTLPAALDGLTLPFTQIEAIIADRLPASARKNTAWWANELSGKHTQAHSWLDSGWWVKDIDLELGWVRLCRRLGEPGLN